MKIIHHIDDDGLCAAAIVNNHLITAYNRPLNPETDNIPYSHGWGLKLPENVVEGETVYIVDLALDAVIYNAIEYFVNKGCKVIHIDHHKTTFETLDSLNDEQKAVMDKITKFYKIGQSATLLTWVYYCMTTSTELCSDPMSAVYDFTETMSHLRFNPNTPQSTEDIYIPQVVRYVNDYDIWSFQFAETLQFHLGFANIEDKRPFSRCWIDLFNSERVFVKKYMDDGAIIQKFEENQFKMMLSKSFESTIHGIKCLCVNTPVHTSRLLGSKISDYPVCVLFHFDGKSKLWKYSIYSDDDGIDVSEIATRFGGGGHEHAAGFQEEWLVFSEFVSYPVNCYLMNEDGEVRRESMRTDKTSFIEGKKWFAVDELVVPLIRVCREAGYKTMFSCSGHLRIDPYLVIEGEHTFYNLPDGWITKPFDSKGSVDGTATVFEYTPINKFEDGDGYASFFDRYRELVIAISNLCDYFVENRKR